MMGDSSTLLFLTMVLRKERKTIDLKTDDEMGKTNDFLQIEE